MRPHAVRAKARTTGLNRFTINTSLTTHPVNIPLQLRITGSPLGHTPFTTGSTRSRQGWCWTTATTLSVSEETNVRQAAVKVQLGEADAGIVYSTDVTGDLADDVIRIEIPDSLNELAEYQIAAASAGEDALAQQFIDFVLSEAGQDILEKHGFIRGDQ